MRPRKKESEKRTERIDVRFTKSEYASLMEEMSKTTNRTKGDFVREKLFKRNISDAHIREQEAWIAAGKLSDSVQKIGVNYNQIAHGINKYQHINFTEHDRKVLLATGQLLKLLYKKLGDVEL